VVDKKIIIGKQGGLRRRRGTRGRWPPKNHFESKNVASEPSTVGSNPARVKGFAWKLTNNRSLIS
jgi:hypothetical protein